MNNKIAFALAAAAGLLAAGAAQAGNVYWSVGISTPPVATVISNGPVYAPQPVYVEPPVVYQPAPVIYAPPPRVVYRPVPVVVSPPVVYRPAQVVYTNGYWDDGRRHHKHKHKRHWKDRHHDEYGSYHRDGRWEPVPADPRRRRHD